MNPSDRRERLYLMPILEQEKDVEPRASARLEERTDLADRLFKIQCWDEEDGPCPDPTAEQEMLDILKSAAVPFERIGWDYYDASLEIYGVADDWRMSAALQRKIWECGFIKVYVNHPAPERWETHYSFGTPAGFVARHGWRVSYPHKRKDESGQIWVEEKCESWPRKWFRTFFGLIKPYVVIKPPSSPSPKGGS